MRFVYDCADEKLSLSQLVNEVINRKSSLARAAETASLTIVGSDRAPCVNKNITVSRG
jgi:hypothetical protein